MNSPFSAFYFFFVLGKCVLIRACYHMYTSQSRKKTFKTAWVAWTTNHTNWNWLLIGSKFVGVSITFLGHCLESYCCFCLLTLYVMFVLYMQRFDYKKDFIFSFFFILLRILSEETWEPILLFCVLIGSCNENQQAMRHYKWFNSSTGIFIWKKDLWELWFP